MPCVFTVLGNAGAAKPLPAPSSLLLSLFSFTQFLSHSPINQSYKSDSMKRPSASSCSCSCSISVCSNKIATLATEVPLWSASLCVFLFILYIYICVYFLFYFVLLFFWQFRVEKIFMLGTGNREWDEAHVWVFACLCTPSINIKFD